MYLPIHLPNEVRLGGPVEFRWMYPIDKYLYFMLSYLLHITHALCFMLSM